MPFTPFHLGSSLFFAVLFSVFINIPVFLIASLIVDIEPIIILLFDLDYPLHGFFHSFIGATLLGVFLGFFWCILQKNTSFNNLLVKLDEFDLLGNNSKLSVYFSAILSVLIHVILDAFLYSDIRPFFPSEENPLLNKLSYSEVYGFCVVSFLLGLFLYLLKQVVNKYFQKRS
jgi:membrane-bound metal-dependent hydrolase YbcI (DUF457 family)